MRSHVRGLLLGFAMLTGLLWVGEGAAISSGGSRLLFYFSNRSFSARGPANNASTLMLLSNASATPTKIAYKFYRGSNCAETTLALRDVGPNQTVTFDSSV